VLQLGVRTADESRSAEDVNARLNHETHEKHERKWKRGQGEAPEPPPHPPHKLPVQSNHSRHAPAPQSRGPVVL
jgi:hypothetical protein